MEEFQTEWKREELRMYIFIYCANADFVINKDEMELIKAKVPTVGFERILEEFEGDNDYASIQKIKQTLKRLRFTEDERAKLLDDIKKLFKVDGEYDVLEKNLLIGIHRLFDL